MKTHYTISLILVVLLIANLNLFAQESKARSKSGRLFQKKEPVEEVTKEKEVIDKEAADPGTVGVTTGAVTGEFVYQVPFLEAEMSFTESSGNNILDANEDGTLSVVISNLGKMTAKNCQLQFTSEEVNPHITSMYDKVLGDVAPGESREIYIFVHADDSIQAGQTKFTFRILEDNGFDLDPEKVLTLYTNEFQPPLLEIVDYGIEDQNRNLKIEKFEVVDVTFRIQNRGASSSYGTTAYIDLGNNVIPMDMQDTYSIGELKSGEYKDIAAKIATNARAQEVKINVSIFEETGKYPYEQTFELPFDVVQKRKDEIVIAKADESGSYIPDVANLKLDIAENIPKTNNIREHAIAVVIGNKNYTDVDIPSVEYALNDAALVKNYFVNALGIREENIFYLENATQSDFFSIFGTETNYKGKLYDYTVKGLSEIFVYYSGHGAPDPESDNSYIVPVDCDPNRVSLNGYSLKTLYANLDKISSEMNVPHVTVILDACFSGNSQGGSILRDISPIYIKVKDNRIAYENSSIFTSASGEQVSSWYTDKKQSLFTYYFLKGLKGEADSNNDNLITARELYEYTADEIHGVPQMARRLNGRTQTPTLIGEAEYQIFK
jgi:hypothetical protein